MSEPKRPSRQDSVTDEQHKRQRLQADDDVDVDMGRHSIDFEIVKTSSLSSCTFMLLAGEVNGKIMGYLSHSPVVYQRPFTPTTTAAVLINEMTYNINEYLLTHPEFIDKTSANVTNIIMIVGGGGVVKPDYFRNGFALINNDRNNIPNHLTTEGSQELYDQIKNHVKIFPPITFILSDEVENQGAVGKAVVDPPDIKVVFCCDSRLLTLSTYWKKGSYTYIIASMTINLDKIDGNSFTWELEENEILTAREMLKDVPETLNDFNQVADYVMKRLNDDSSSCSSTDFYSVYSPIQAINNDHDLNQKLTSVAEILVIVYFFGKNSSTSIAPDIDYLNDEYLNVIFLKADVKKCLNEAAKYSVEDTPVFLFFQYAQEVDRVLAVNKELIEKTIKKYSKSTLSEEIQYTNLKSFIQEKSCMAINVTGQWQDFVFDTQSDIMFGSNNNDPEVKI